MSCDCYVVLPHNVSIADVARVAGKLFGCTSKLEPIGRGESHRYVVVKGARVEQVKGTPAPEIAILMLERLEECEHCRHARPVSSLCLTYHFEGNSLGGGRRVTLGRSLAERIALGRGLADFFGGTVCYSDARDEADYAVVWKSDAENCPEDGAPYQELQQRIHALAALTPEAIAFCRQWSAYGE